MGTRTPKMADDSSTTTTGTTTQTTDTTQWYSALDADTQAYITSKGLADKPAHEAFAQAAKSHREAEAYIGTPADQLLKLPKADAKPEEWDAVHTRLGRPVTADKYDLAGVKFTDGSEVDAAFTDFVRAEAFKGGLSQAAATAMAQGFVNFLEKQTAADAGEQTAALEAQRSELKASWGQNFDANLFIARQAALKLGLTPEQVAAMETSMGYKNLMEAFSTIGRKIGEDTFVADTSRGDGTMTADQAKARIAEMKTDSDFQKRLLAGGAAEAREFKAMHEIVDAAEKRAA